MYRSGEHFRTEETIPTPRSKLQPPQRDVQPAGDRALPGGLAGRGLTGEPVRDRPPLPLADEQPLHDVHESAPAHARPARPRSPPLPLVRQPHHRRSRPPPARGRAPDRARRPPAAAHPPRAGLRLREDGRAPAPGRGGHHRAAARAQPVGAGGHGGDAAEGVVHDGRGAERAARGAGARGGVLGRRRPVARRAPLHEAGDGVRRPAGVARRARPAPPVPRSQAPHPGAQSAPRRLWLVGCCHAQGVV